MARLGAHSIKGAAGSLGAEQLAAAAARLEARLQEGAAAAALDVVPLASQVHALQQALQPWVPTLPPADLAHAGRARAALPALERLLAQADAEALYGLDTHEAGLRAMAGPAGDLLAARIRAFDFAGARQTLQALRALP